MWLRPWLPGIATFALTIGGVTGCFALTVDDGAPPRRLIQPRAIDGDSVAFRALGEGGSIIDGARVGFVNTPEKGSGECGEREATAFTRRWLSGRDEIKTPQIGKHRSRSSGSPTVQIVGTDNEDLGLALVRSGWGRVVVHRDLSGDARDYLTRLQTAQAEARRDRLGTWGRCT